MGGNEEAAGVLAAKLSVMFPHLDERQGRLLMSAEARALGHGGIRTVARATGVREATVSLGVDELEAGAEPLGRARAADLDPRLRPALRCACQRQGTAKLLTACVRSLTVGEWLEEWLDAKKKLRAATVRSYESHIRLHLVPRIGHIPLNRLRVADVASVFDYVDDLNEAVTAARTGGDPAAQRRLGTCHRTAAP